MDYYKILGVAGTASQEEIRMAYRKLALQYHPDRNPGDATAEAKFKEVKMAYEALTHKSYRPPPTREKPQPRKRPQKPVVRRDGFRIYDAPPPPVDIWGRPMSNHQKMEWMKANKIHSARINKLDRQMEKGWKDSVDGTYESGGSPDIR